MLNNILISNNDITININNSNYLLIGGIYDITITDSVSNRNGIELDKVSYLIPFELNGIMITNSSFDNSILYLNNCVNVSVVNMIMIGEGCANNGTYNNCGGSYLMNIDYNDTKINNLISTKLINSSCLFVCYINYIFDVCFCL